MPSRSTAAIRHGNRNLTFIRMSGQIGVAFPLLHPHPEFWSPTSITPAAVLRCALCLHAAIIPNLSTHQAHLPLPVACSPPRSAFQLSFHVNATSPTSRSRSHATDDRKSKHYLPLSFESPPKMDSLDLEILAAIRRNEQDLKRMLAGADGDFEEALQLLHEVQQVKLEFASIKKRSSLRSSAPVRTLRKRTRNSSAKKRDMKPIRVSHLSSTLLSLSLN